MYYNINRLWSYIQEGRCDGIFLEPCIQVSSNNQSTDVESCLIQIDLDTNSQGSERQQKRLFKAKIKIGSSVQFEFCEGWVILNFMNEDQRQDQMVLRLSSDVPTIIYWHYGI